MGLEIAVLNESDEATSDEICDRAVEQKVSEREAVWILIMLPSTEQRSAPGPAWKEQREDENAGRSLRADGSSPSRLRVSGRCLGYGLDA